MGKYLDGNGLSHFFSLIKAFFVQKAGDTMTGALRVSNSDITKGVVPSSSKYNSNLIFTDANDEQIGYFGALQQTDGREGVQFGTSRTVNGSGVYNSMHLGVTSSGSRYVYFDDAAAWRSALGVPALSAANAFTNTATYRSSTLDRDRASTVSTEASSNSFLKFTDKDNESIGYIKHREGTDGKMSMDIFMETETSGHVKTSNGLTMSVDKSGNRFVSVTDPSAWRDAILPSVSASDNGKVLQVSNGAWAAATPSGGGGGSTVTLYTNGSYTNLWTDQSLSTTLLDYAGYDYKTAYDILHDSSSVYVENSNNDQWSARYGVVLASYFDSVDETLYVLVAHAMANISSSTIGSVLRYVSCS